MLAYVFRTAVATTEIPRKISG